MFGPALREGAQQVSIEHGFRKAQYETGVQALLVGPKERAIYFPVGGLVSRVENLLTITWETDSTVRRFVGLRTLYLTCNISNLSFSARSLAPLILGTTPSLAHTIARKLHVSLER